jgi:hypothetical protein
MLLRLITITFLIFFLLLSCSKGNEDKVFGTPQGNLADITRLELQNLHLQEALDSLQNLNKQLYALNTPVELVSRNFSKTVQRDNAVMGDEELKAEAEIKNKEYSNCKVDSLGFVWEQIDYDKQGKIKIDEKGMKIFIYRYLNNNMVEKTRYQAPNKIGYRIVYRYDGNKRVSSTTYNSDGKKENTLPLTEVQVK